MYAQDVVGAPIVMAAFGAGCMSSGLLALATVKWFVPWYERASGLVQPTTVRIVPPRWTSKPMFNHQVVVDIDSPHSFAYLYVRAPEEQAWGHGYLTADDASSLTDWLNQQLKGVTQ
jgi:hypothetical protein